MALPPGGSPIDVPTISRASSPQLADAAAELNAWIQYLLHPESNDGPRIYRNLHPMYPDSPDPDFETPRRMPPAQPDARYEDPREYQTLSVLKDFAADTSVFFKAAEAVSGTLHDTIEATYNKLTVGCLTWSDGGARPENNAVKARYEEQNRARDNWIEMRKTWVAPESVNAHEYENDFIQFQVYTENCFYVVAEHLVRYRAIFHKASLEMADVIKAMVAQCPKPSPPGQGTIDLFSVIVTGIVSISTMVITGGVTAARMLGATVAEMLGEGMKTAKDEKKVQDQKFGIGSHYYLKDTVKEYLAAMDKIKNDAAEGVKQLYESLRVEVDGLRRLREHDLMPSGGKMSTTVPHFREYL